MLAQFLPCTEVIGYPLSVMLTKKEILVWFFLFLSLRLWIDKTINKYVDLHIKQFIYLWECVRACVFMAVFKTSIPTYLVPVLFCWYILFVMVYQTIHRNSWYIFRLCLFGLMILHNFSRLFFPSISYLFFFWLISNVFIFKLCFSGFWLIITTLKHIFLHTILFEYFFLHFIDIFRCF